MIERVLAAEGDVIFVPPGSMGAWRRIVLLVRDQHPEGPTQMPEMKPPA